MNARRGSGGGGARDRPFRESLQRVALGKALCTPVSVSLHRDSEEMQGKWQTIFIFKWKTGYSSPRDFVLTFPLVSLSLLREGVFACVFAL